MGKVKEKTMTNKKNRLGILAIVLVFGITAVGCDNGSTGGGGGGIPGGGTFTLTGIPLEYNGKDVAFMQNPGGVGSELMLMGAQSISSASRITPGKISGGSVALTMWIMTNGVISGYTGNDTVTHGSVTIEDIIIWAPSSPITFVNGNATITWSQGITESFH
jgi:hypothetical protein